MTVDQSTVELSEAKPIRVNLNQRQIKKSKTLTFFKKFSILLTKAVVAWWPLLCQPKRQPLHFFFNLIYRGHLLNGTVVRPCLSWTLTEAVVPPVIILKKKNDLFFQFLDANLIRPSLAWRRGPTAMPYPDANGG